MALAPEKAADMYGIQNPSALTSQFAEWSGGAMLMIAIASILSLGGMDFTKALAWGSVPTLVQNVQGLLKDSASKLGFGVMAKFMPVIVSAVLTAGLFGVGLDSALALKITAGWMGLNGLGCYFATEPFLKAWEVRATAPRTPPPKTGAPKTGALAASRRHMVSHGLWLSLLCAHRARR